MMLATSKHVFKIKTCGNLFKNHACPQSHVNSQNKQGVLANQMLLVSTMYNNDNYEKLGHCIMRFKEFDWLSGHGR